MCVWNHPSSTVNDTYVNLDLNHRSCIDHFLVSMNIFHAVLRSYVVESVDNHSHHHPIRLKAKLNINLNTSVTRKHNSTDTFIDWSKVNDKQIYNYEYLLDNLLSQIDIEDDALHCKDLFCASESHKAFINKMCHKLINTTNVKNMHLHLVVSKLVRIHSLLNHVFHKNLNLCHFGKKM